MLYENLGKLERIKRFITKSVPQDKKISRKRTKFTVASLEAFEAAAKENALALVQIITKDFKYFKGDFEMSKPE
jgi:hypothetical protein